MTIGNFWHNWHRLACPDILLSSQFIARLIFYQSYIILYTIHPWSPVMLIVAEQSRREIAAPMVSSGHCSITEEFCP